MIRSISSDVKISYSQIEEVLNQDITTLSDEGVSNDLINKLAHGRNKEYTITLLKSIDDKDRLLEKDAYYFEIDLLLVFQRIRMIRMFLLLFIQIKLHGHLQVSMSIRMLKKLRCLRARFQIRLSVF